MNFPWRRVILIAVFAVVILIGYFVRLGVSSNPVPPEFAEARAQGSVISQDIVNLSNDFAKDLVRINELDQKGLPQEALNITTDMIQRIPELREKASALSEQLEKMAGALPKIKSEAARQAAIESITNRMTLISRLFSYGEYLSQLSQVLRNHFQERPDNRSVPALITAINDEVTAINNFNRAASEAMDRFDKEVGVR